jgi:pilus assembly protein CpaE
VLYGAQRNADGALLTTHLAQVVQKSGQQTLLLDLGLPRGDSLALLGLESSFHFGDALRHLRRLDATLIDSAFTRAKGPAHSRLRRQRRAAGADQRRRAVHAAQRLAPALPAHRVNLTGQADSEALRTVSHCDKLILVHRSEHPRLPAQPGSAQPVARKGMKLDHAACWSTLLARVAPDADALANLRPGGDRGHAYSPKCA